MIELPRLRIAAYKKVIRGASVVDTFTDRDADGKVHTLDIYDNGVCMLRQWIFVVGHTDDVGIAFHFLRNVGAFGTDEVFAAARGKLAA